jgi:AhpD family alkylhydroperoxidase
MEPKEMKIDMNMAYDRFIDLMNELGKDYPEYTNSFMGFFKQAEKSGALDAKTKELISIALSVKSQCEYCVAFHVKNAISHKASRPEIIEAAFVAALMGGGPSVAFIRYVIDACDQFGAK